MLFMSRLVLDYREDGILQSIDISLRWSENPSRIDMSPRWGLEEGVYRPAINMSPRWG